VLPKAGTQYNYTTWWKDAAGNLITSTAQAPAGVATVTGNFYGSLAEVDVNQTTAPDKITVLGKEYTINSTKFCISAYAKPGSDAYPLFIYDNGKIIETPYFVKLTEVQAQP